MDLQNEDLSGDILYIKKELKQDLTEYKK